MHFLPSHLPGITGVQLFLIYDSIDVSGAIYYPKVAFAFDVVHSVNGPGPTHTGSSVYNDADRTFTALDVNPAGGNHNLGDVTVTFSDYPTMTSTETTPGGTGLKFNGSGLSLLGITGESVGGAPPVAPDVTTELWTCPFQGLLRSQ